MKLIAESLYEFERSGKVRKTLGIGTEEIFRQFLNGTPYKIDGYPSWRKKTPLWVSARYGRSDFVSYFLTKGADPMEYDSAALRWASGLGYEEIVKLLLDAGADPDAEGTLTYWQKRRYPGEAYAWADRNNHNNIINLLNRSKRGEIFFKQETKIVPEQVPKDESEPNNIMEMKKLIKESLEDKFLDLNENVSFERGGNPKKTLDIGAEKLLQPFSLDSRTGFTPNEKGAIESIFYKDSSEIYLLGFAGEIDYDTWHYNDYTAKLRDLTYTAKLIRSKKRSSFDMFLYLTSIGVIARIIEDEAGIYFIAGFKAASNLEIWKIPESEKESYP